MRSSSAAPAGGAPAGRARRRAGERAWRSCSSPRVDHVVLLHALMKLGAVAVPLDPRLTAPELDAPLGPRGPGC